MATNEEVHLSTTTPGATPAREPTDRSLLERLRGGSQDAATQIYLRYAHRLRALAQAKLPSDLARRVDVDDIVQSVFGSFFRGAKQGFYEVPGSEELWKLFLVIALNKIRAKGAFHRAAKRNVGQTIGGEAIDELAETPAAQDEAAYAVLQLTIDETLQQLPPQHKQILMLRIEGYEVAEIAQQTGRSKRTVERILQECRKHLGDRLDTDSEDPTTIEGAEFE
jgi:RNA polymerase sigma-70 factor (ECF subfamily)